MTEPDDDLAELLSLKPASSNQELLKATILRNTIRQLRAAQRWRIVRRVVGIAAVFSVGTLLGWFVKPTETIVVQSPLETLAVPVPVLVLPFQEESVPTPVVTESAQQLELNAEIATDRKESATFYRRAGDRYLKDADYGQAARCYRLHLNTAGAEGLAVAVEDEWLLMSMKIAQKQETRNALREGS